MRVYFSSTQNYPDYMREVRNIVYVSIPCVCLYSAGKLAKNEQSMSLGFSS